MNQKKSTSNIESSERSLRLWNDVIRPILNFIWKRLSPSTRREIDRLFTPFLPFVLSIFMFYKLVLLIVAEYILIFILSDIYHNPTEYSGGHIFLLIGIGFMVIVLSIFIVIVAKECIIRLLKGAYIAYIFIKSIRT